MAGAQISAKDVAEYELAEWLAGHHHHLHLPLVSGLIEDIEIPGELEQEFR